MSEYPKELDPEKQEALSKLLAIKVKFDAFTESLPENFFQNWAPNRLAQTCGVVREHLKLAIERAKIPNYKMTQGYLPENVELMVESFINLYNSLEVK